MILSREEFEKYHIVRDNPDRAYETIEALAEAAKWHTVYDVTDPNCNAEYYEKWKCLDPILREKGWLE